MKNLLFKFSILFSIFLLTATNGSAYHPNTEAILENMSEVRTRERLIEVFEFTEMRSFRNVEGGVNITFNYRKDGKIVDTVTFYLEDNKVKRWIIDDRDEMAKQYLMEFASGILLSNHKAKTALKNALVKLPKDVFLDVTDRSRPIIFLDHYTKGIARFASSKEFRMRDEDPPTFSDGFYIIQIGSELIDKAQGTEGIEGVILHEIAHRVLEHLRQPASSCEFERDANRLVIKWGYEVEYKKASELFGAKKKGDSPCKDLLNENTTYGTK